MFVVGAGPVGLLLAAELALDGVRTLVVERLARPSAERKARGIGTLAAEALRRRGLGAALAELEELLGEYAAGLGVPVLRGQPLTDLTQDGAATPAA